VRDDGHVHDEESGEWLPARALAERIEARDSVGELLADGDQAALIKDLVVKGAGQTLKPRHADQVDPPRRPPPGDRPRI